MKHVEIGSRVSHYRIERQLGVGGMGAVYLAHDLTLNRPVAIKFLTAPDDAHSRKRVLREAQAVAALDHEGIAAVYEVGEDPAGGDFIVMQYVEGETLAARLRRGRLQPAEALAIGGRMAEALVAAHRSGIIHRDLKPQNIIITPAGMPKLLDFGLAQRIVSADASGETETASESTTRRSVVGTPGYMAPEQVRNQPVDARSDVFALGCVLYECLTGRRAFTGTSSADVFGEVLHVEPPAASSIAPELGPSHDAFCARLLRKSANERFQSAEEVLGAIHGLEDTAKLTSSDSAGHAPEDSEGVTVWTTLRSQTRRTTLVATVLLVVVTLMAWQSYRGDSLPTPPADAAHYYELGVEALRDGTYARARSNFTEALNLFPNYVQAFSGLAHAHMELDDESSAQSALLRVDQLMPDRTRLPKDDRLRLEAVLASVTRTHDRAIVAYAELVERHPNDSGAWLDLGRAKEAAEHRKEARADYGQALALNAQSPAVHVRLGALLVSDGKKDEALPFFVEAMRLYRVQGNVEGEAEALLRKGMGLNNTGELAAATEAFQEVVRLAGDRYVSQRARAQFELARVAAQKGRPEDAVAPTEAVLHETTNAGLFTIAANGLISFASLFLVTDPDRADAELGRAIEMAVAHGARRTELRAQLQRAFLRTLEDKAEEGIALAAAPLAFYADGRYPLQEAVAKNIVSRAKEALGEFDEASRLANEALQFADSIGDGALANDSLQSLAGQLPLQGRLPEALPVLERSADIYRKEDQVRSLAYTLRTQAEMLIILGRGQEAEAALAEVERGITTGTDTNASQPRRVARLRALRAAIEGRFADVGTHAALARGARDAAPSSIDRSAKALAEYAAANLGRSQTPTATLVAWPADASSPEEQAELSFWVAQTLRARDEYGQAHEVATAAWRMSAAQVNVELRWRLAAVATLPTGPPTLPNSATLPASGAEDDLQKLKILWGQYDSTAYFGRSDLKPLLENKIKVQ